MLRLLSSLMLALALLSACNLVDVTPGLTPNAPTSTPSPFPEPEPVQFYLIIPEDDGASADPVGCGDSIQPVTSGALNTGDPAADLEAALAALFAVDTETYGESGLVNSLYDQDLTVETVEVAANRATIALGGSLMLAGVCADARMEAQLLRTIFEVEGFDDALITVGDRNLKQVFDASGLVEPDAVYTRAEAAERWGA